MEKTTSMKYTMASMSNPNIEPPTRDKNLSLDPVILFYEREYGDNTEEGKEAKILVIHE